MPLIYQIDGVPKPFEPIREVQPVAETFATTLSEEIKKANTHIIARGDSKPQLPPSYAEADLDKKRHSSNKRKPALKAQDMMTRNVITISPSLPLEEARNRMNQHRIRHLPVVTDDDRIIGILSDRDLLQAGEKMSLLISERMSRAVLTATPDTPIREIAQVMLEKRIHTLPIVNSLQKLVGIVSTSDLLQAIINPAPLELWT